MAYIGKTPQVGAYQKCDALTASATADYTLQVGSSNVSPESVNHMIVSLNGVIQQPTTAYTVAGAVLSFNSALTSNDTIDFVILLGNVLDIGTPSDDTVATAKIQNDAVTLAKMAAGTDGNIISYDTSGNPVAVATGNDGQVLTSSGAGAVCAFEDAGGADTIWDLKKNGDQASISDNTATKITTWTATIDTDSAWDNTNNKIVIPSGKDGKYLVSATITQTQTSGNNSQNDTYDLSIYKNGSYLLTNHDKSRAGLDFSTNHISIIADLSATDYLEIYVKVTAGAGTTTVLEHSSFQTSNVCSNWSGVRLAS
jgi:hypothetical protein